MGYNISCPPIGSQFDALETIAAHVCLHEVSLVVGIEGVELVSHQTLNVRGVALLGLFVVIDELKVVVARHDTALVEHHGAQRHRTVAVTVEGEGLSHLLAYALRPYLHFQLRLADGRHDVDVVFGGI